MYIALNAGMSWKPYKPETLFKQQQGSTRQGQYFKKNTEHGSWQKKLQSQCWMIFFCSMKTWVVYKLLWIWFKSALIPAVMRRLLHLYPQNKHIYILTFWWDHSLINLINTTLLLIQSSHFLSLMCQTYPE